MKEDNSNIKDVKSAKREKTADKPKKSSAPHAKGTPEEIKKKRLNRITVWTIKVVLITFLLSALFSYISELTTQTAPLAVAFLLLLLLIVISIIFDAIGVAATACDLAPILSMAARKVKGSKIAISIVKNSEKVSNFCGDVIGDICGIVSGACSVAIVFKIINIFELSSAAYWLTIAFSSIVAAMTVGLKSIFKEIAIHNAKDVVMFVARILSVFTKNK